MVWFLVSLLVINLNEKNMNTEYTAVLKNEEGWWIGWIEEISGVCAKKKREKN